MALALDPSSLSLSTGRGVLDPGKDVLQCWPHEYNSAVENQRWAAALPDWADACGQRGGTKLNCGFEEFTMNYAYDALFDSIPSGTERGNEKVVLFTANKPEDHLAKRRNFHAALAYIQHYPRQYGNEIQRTLGVSKGIFVQQVVPTIYSIAGKMAL